MSRSVANGWAWLGTLLDHWTRAVIVAVAFGGPTILVAWRSRTLASLLVGALTLSLVVFMEGGYEVWHDAMTEPKAGAEPVPMSVDIVERDPLVIAGGQAVFFRLIVRPRGERQTHYRAQVIELRGEKQPGYAEATFTCSWRDGDNLRAVKISPHKDEKTIDLAKLRRLSDATMRDDEIDRWYPTVQFTVFQGDGIPPKDEPAPFAGVYGKADMSNARISAHVVVIDDEAGLPAGSVWVHFGYEMREGIYEPYMEISPTVASTPS